MSQFYEKSYLAQLQERLPAGLTDCVTFSGAFPYSRLVDRYREAGVFVFPSVCQEAFGMPIIEAMACQVPVVATRSGGITEVVEDGSTGLLVERGDATALAQALMLLLANDELRRRMGTAARQRVRERFSWERIAADLYCEYERMLGNTASQYPSGLN
ncbi:MAG: glycosyltransferase family 4 protein [bacterium]